jgi:hypothetical protein
LSIGLQSEHDRQGRACSFAVRRRDLAEILRQAGIAAVMGGREEREQSN